MRRALAASVVVLLFVGGIAVGQTPRTDREALEAIGQILVEQGIVLTTTQTTAPTTTETTAQTTTTAVPTTTQASTTTTLPPTTTTVPACQGVQVEAGSNLANLARAHPAGTTFCLAAGNYPHPTVMAPRANQKWVGALGSNGERLSIVTGNNTTAYFSQCHVSADCVGLQFKNFILERFKSPLQQNPIQGPVDQTVVNWLIDNVESRENAATGLGSPNGTIVRNSYIHHNHQMGVHGQGDNVLWENNEIAFNNYLNEVDPNWEAGGSKWVNTGNLTVRGNYVHDNCGPGLWTDIDNIGTVYENNRVVNNAGVGIFHEISQAAIIRNNYVEGNGLGQDANPACGYRHPFGIYVSSSRDVEVHGNVLVNNDGGIVSQQESRGSGFRGTHVVQNLNVHDNDTTLQVGYSGFRYVSGLTGNTNIRFENDSYDVPTLTGQWWMWQPSTGGGLRTWTQWQQLGHDDTGSIR